MWVVMQREARQDAPTWPGRRLLAVADAAVWPLLWMALAQQLPQPTGLVGPTIVALAVLSATGRLYRAAWVNHRYWFTTWRWGKVAGALVLMGAVLKLTMPG